MSRQATPDIMGSLMGNTATIDREQENHKAIKQEENRESSSKKEGSLKEELESNKTIKVEENKAISQDSNKTVKQEMKEKATFNLTASALESLENAWMRLRRSFKGEQRITKTAIVEMALEICIADLEEKQMNSALYKKFVHNRDDNPS
jgi:hypothetical protein